VMRIVNLSHGSYFLLGGYVALSVIWTTGSWLLAIPVAALTIALVGVAMERVFLRPLGFDPLRQVLLTVGFAFLFQQAALDIWTGNNFDINPPDALTKSIVVGGLYLPLYRIFMIATALIIGVVLWLAMEKTRMGAAVRATVDDAQMARGVGIDTNKISMLIFALGAGMAALGGVIGGAFLGNYAQKKYESKQPGEQIVVRLTSGVLVVVTQPVGSYLRVGQRVYVEGAGQSARVVAQNP